MVVSLQAPLGAVALPPLRGCASCSRGSLKVKLTFLSCHPEFISGSTNLRGLKSTPSILPRERQKRRFRNEFGMTRKKEEAKEEMLKQVQHDEEKRDSETRPGIKQLRERAE